MLRNTERQPARFYQLLNKTPPKKTGLPLIKGNSHEIQLTASQSCRQQRGEGSPERVFPMREEER